MAMTNTINKNALLEPENREWTTTKVMYKVGGISTGGTKHRIVDKEYGTNSISHLVSQMLADNVSTKVINDIKLAQLMTARPDKGANECEPDESAQFGSIMKSAYKSKKQMIAHDAEDAMKKKVIDTTLHLREVNDKRKAEKAEQAQADKNKKRNAKRRAKAKATKKTLNFTPTAEQEKDVNEWFWGAPPTDC